MTEHEINTPDERRKYLRKFGGYAVWAALLVVVIPAMQERDLLAITRPFRRGVVEGAMLVGFWYVLIFAVLVFAFTFVPTWFGDKKVPDRE